MSYLSNLSHFKRATNISVSPYLFFLNALCSPQIRNTFYKTWHLRNQGHFGDQKSSLKTFQILTCFLSRVTLHPPKQEKNFSSSGAQRELTLILREIRVNTKSLSICTSIWRYTVRSVIVVWSGDHVQTEGRRRRRLHRERLEVCRHGEIFSQSGLRSTS